MASGCFEDKAWTQGYPGIQGGIGMSRSKTPRDGYSPNGLQLLLRLHVILCDSQFLYSGNSRIMDISRNPLLKHARGALGKAVYCKQLWGKTWMCNMPKKPDKSKETEAQRTTRCNFRDAAHYAKSILKDPAQKAYYQRKAQKLGLPNAYTAALTDFMRKSKIESVSRKKYTGKAGGEIKVVVRKKDFAVREVQVRLSKVTGELIEEGKAIRNTEGNWIYKNTVAVKDAGAVVLQVRVTDVNGQPVT